MPIFFELYKGGRVRNAAQILSSFQTLLFLKVVAKFFEQKIIALPSVQKRLSPKNFHNLAPLLIHLFLHSPPPLPDE